MTNAATWLLEANRERGDHPAVIDSAGVHTYAEVTAQAERFGSLLLGAGLVPGDRVLLALTDTVAFPICFIGAMRVGVVPVPLNTLLTAEDYAFIAEDSGAAAMVASPSLTQKLPACTQRWVTGTDGPPGWRALDTELGEMQTSIK